MDEEEKLGLPEEVRQEIREAQNWMCHLCHNRIVDFHHKLSNTKSNRKLFPLFLNSVFNCVGLCRACHGSDKRFVFKVTLQEAAVYEGCLGELKDGNGRS